MGPKLAPVGRRRTFRAAPRPRRARPPYSPAVLARLARFVPTPVVRLAVRAMAAFPALRPGLERLAGAIAAGEGTVQRGVGKGLRFRADVAVAGYRLGTTEPEFQRALAHHVRPGAVVYDLGADQRGVLHRDLRPTGRRRGPRRHGRDRRGRGHAAPRRGLTAVRGRRSRTGGAAGEVVAPRPDTARRGGGIVLRPPAGCNFRPTR